MVNHRTNIEKKHQPVHNIRDDNHDDADAEDDDKKKRKKVLLLRSLHRWGLRLRHWFHSNTAENEKNCGLFLLLFFLFLFGIVGVFGLCSSMSWSNNLERGTVSKLEQTPLLRRIRNSTDWLDKPSMIQIIALEDLKVDSIRSLSLPQNKVFQELYRYNKVLDVTDQLYQLYQLPVSTGSRSTNASNDSNTTTSTTTNRRHYEIIENDPETNILYSHEVKMQRPITPMTRDGCKPMEDWQVGHRPTCSNLHEVDLTNLVQIYDPDIAREKNRTVPKYENSKFPYHFQLVGYGAYRDVWSIREYDGTQRALKTLRIAERRTFDLKSWDRHRRDAIALDQLTFSPYIVDIFGYCSNSAFFELGTGATLYDYFPNNKDARRPRTQTRTHRRIRRPPRSRHHHRHLSIQETNSTYEEGAKTNNDKDTMNEITEDNPTNDTRPEPTILHRLQTAYNISMAISHAHIISPTAGLATIAHTDIKPDQFLLENGMYKLTDFNRARLLPWNPTTGKVCGFTVLANRGTWRSPEEYMYVNETEKVDVFSLGNILYFLVAKRSPWNEVEDAFEVAKKVGSGETPPLPNEIEQLSTWTNDQLLSAKHNDPKLFSQVHFVQTIVHAMKLCFVFDPELRPSAQEVANAILDGINTLLEYYNSLTPQQKGSLLQPSTTT